MSGKKKMEGNPDANLTSIGNYIFQKTLGEGNFAKVKLAKHKITNQEVAIKIIDKMQLDEKKLSKLYREVRIMKLLHHPNIVKLYEVVETKNTIFLVMEYISGGELYDYLVVHGRMKEKEARAKFRQILHGVSYCHKKRVIHRDLKAENLLLDANLNVKIADFGFSNQFDPDGKLDTFCGSPPYAAPELFQGKRYTGPEVDVWSLGVILYVLTTGCLPFDGKNLQEMRESVCKGKYRIPFYLSEGCEKLLRKFLIRDPTKRPDLDFLVDDPWLNEGYDTPAVVTEVVNEETVGEDKLIISIMESKFGVDKETIARCLKDNIYDDIMAIYFLLWNEKHKNGEAAVIKIGESMAIKQQPVSTAAQPKETKQPIQVPAATPITAIVEEDGSTDAINKVKKSDVAPAEAQAAAAPTIAVVPRAGPVKRARRSTVSGEAEMRKIAIEEQEDPNLLAKLKNLQVTKADESITATQKKAEEEPVVVPRIKATAATAAVVPAKARPVSVAVPNEPEREKKPPAAVPAEAPAPVAAAPVARPEGRKRTNTITGFLKLGRPVVDKEQPAAAATNGQADNAGDMKKSEESIDSTASTDPSKPRSLRFTFNSNTTSSKNPDDIVQEIINSVVKNDYKHRTVSKYLVEVTAPPPNDLPGAETVRVEVEVCKLPRLKNLHGLRFKRVSGASADYKVVCEQLLSGIQL